MSEQLLMPEARVPGQDGSADTAVMLPGARLRPDAVHYDEGQHKGKLVCAHCSAKVHFNAGAQTVCGDNLRGPQAHFKRNPGQKHKQDCLIPMRLDEGRDPKEYDLTRGYRIHLNLGLIANEFNAKSRLFHRDGDGRIIFSDPDLAAREPYTAKTAGDLVKLMEHGHYRRLRDSVVVHRDTVTPWSEFFIRYNRRGNGRVGYPNPRFVGLVEKLSGEGARAALPVLLEFKLQKPVEPKEGATSAHGLSRAITWKQEGNKTHIIQPRVFIDNLRDEGVAGSMKEPGIYLLLGMARQGIYSEWDRVKHFLNISVTRADQILKKDVAEIIETPQLPLGIPGPR